MHAWNTALEFGLPAPVARGSCSSLRGPERSPSQHTQPTLAVRHSTSRPIAPKACSMTLRASADLFFPHPPSRPRHARVVGRADSGRGKTLPSPAPRTKRLPARRSDRRLARTHLPVVAPPFARHHRSLHLPSDRSPPRHVRTRPRRSRSQNTFRRKQPRGPYRRSYTPRTSRQARPPKPENFCSRIEKTCESGHMIHHHQAPRTHYLASSRPRTTTPTAEMAANT